MSPRAPLGVLALALLAGCAQGGTWRHQVSHDHPLAGRLWDVAGERFIVEAELLDRLVAADFVMLGEKHDNADHHRLQARLLAAMAEAGRRPVVGFEMITGAQAPALERHLAARPGDARGLGAALDWEGRGWPQWRAYRPIARAALDNDLAIAAAGMPRETARRVAAQGFAALDPGRVSRLGLDAPLDPAGQAALEDELRAAHCDLLPDSLLPAMARVQRARDAVMADNLLRAAEGGDGGVLITGAGHARKDRGVPAAIARLRPGATQASLAFVEVEGGMDEPLAYAEHYGAERLPFDVVWFTPRVDDDDPCEKMIMKNKASKTIS